MSIIIETAVGSFRAIKRGQTKSWLWACPKCLRWGNLSLDQWDGRTSVWCDTKFTKPGESKPVSECSYHETHDFAAALLERLAALGQEERK